MPANLVNTGNWLTKEIFMQMKIAYNKLIVPLTKHKHEQNVSLNF